MAKALKKYMGVDVVAFLEEKMTSNTKYFQTDFELDKEMFSRFAQSEHKDDKTLLWLSRTHGTQCARESEAFIKNSGDYSTWQYYASEAERPFVAFAVEMIGVKDGKVMGNLYELDYLAHAEMVKKNAVPASDVVKTFADGFVAQVSIDRSSYGYWLGFTEEHGAVVESRTLPEDKEMLGMILAEQKRERDKMKPAKEEVRTVDDILANASARCEVSGISGSKDKDFVMQ